MNGIARHAVTLSSVNVVATTLLMQVVLLVIISVASALCGRLYDQWQPFYRKLDRSVYGALILVFALVTIGILSFSDAFEKNWSPIFGELPVQIAAETAVTWVFVVDILVVTFLVLNSGGAAISPFTPIFFLLPTIALLLRQSRGHVILYTVLVSVAFTLSLIRSVQIGERRSSQPGGGSRALWIVTISSFWLTVYIGLLPNRG